MDEDLKPEGWRHYFKMCARYVGMIAGAFILYFVAATVVGVYEARQAEEKVDAAAQALDAARQKDYDLAMADTYGGKTPQETLQLYIAAVEKGDYELASKYFIGANKEKALSILKNIPAAELEKALILLKEDLKIEGSYSEKKDRFVISRPLLVEMKLYPNGIWKIIEI